MDHGATLQRVEGDAIIAFWGAPTPTPDHAVQGCLSVILGLCIIGTLHTVRTALVGAAVVLLPALPLYGQVWRHSNQEAHEASL